MSGYFSIKRFFYLCLGGALLYQFLGWGLGLLQGSIAQLHFGQDIGVEGSKNVPTLKALEGSFETLFFQYAPNTFYLGSIAFLSAIFGAFLLFQSRNQEHLHRVLNQIFIFLKAMPAVLSVLFVLLFFSIFEISAPQRLSFFGAVVWGLHSSLGLFRFFSAQVRWEEGREYVVTALAKGLSPKRVFFKHIFKNAFPWLLLYLVQLLGGLLTGVYLLEIVLDLPGLGYLLNLAIRLRDSQLILNLVLFTYLIEAVGLSLTIPKERSELLT